MTALTTPIVAVGLDPLTTELISALFLIAGAALISAMVRKLRQGTFLRGLIHIGEHQTPAGRVGEAPAMGLSLTLERLGFALADVSLASRIRAELGPWAVSGPALSIGEAALRDQHWLAEATVRLQSDRQRISQG